MRCPSEMEEPVECDCGKWMELQDTIPCRKCNDLYCRNCLKHGLCELCDEFLSEDQESETL